LGSFSAITVGCRERRLAGARGQFEDFSSGKGEALAGARGQFEDFSSGKGGF